MAKKVTTQLKIESHQRGVALFLSLVLLMIITVLGISSVQTTTMQERMARNARDTNLAFQSAESAIKDAETLIETFNSLTAYDAADANANGLYYETDYNAAPNWSNVVWSDANGGYITAPTDIDGVSDSSKYIIEFVTAVVADEDRLNLSNIGQDTGSGRTQVFRVTVYGTGGTNTTHVMIQSTYGKRF